MTRTAPPLPAPEAGDDLRAAVARIARAVHGPAAGVRKVEFRPGPAASTHPLALLRVRLTDGRAWPVLVKDLSPASVPERLQGVRPRFTTDPAREGLVYRHALGAGGPRFYGTDETTPGRYWVFLEPIRGRALTLCRWGRAWTATAAFAATLHTRLPAARLPRPLTARLPQVDAAWLTRWARRAARFASGPADQVAAVRRLSRRYDRVTRAILAWPAALIHGELYPMNVLVRRDEPVLIDWETAAIGPGLLDLAALCAGSWPEDRRAALAEAYYAALPAGGRPPPAAFRTTLDWCRLHVAVQWVGWSAGWRPPADQPHDWLADAAALADRLGV